MQGKKKKHSHSLSNAHTPQHCCTMLSGIVILKSVLKKKKKKKLSVIIPTGYCVSQELSLLKSLSKRLAFLQQVKKIQTYKRLKMMPI